MIRLTALLSVTAAALVAAGPAAAQSKGGDRVNMVIAYDETECPQPTSPDEIVVCEILVEADRYRIPRNLRQSDSPQNTAWAERVESIRYIGAFGTMSCDPAGAGGFTGCTQKMIEAAYADRAEGENVRFGQLIEAARQERLATIDESAASEQERVEAIEREYMERLERERSGQLPGEEKKTPAVGPEDDGPGS